YRPARHLLLLALHRRSGPLTLHTSSTRLVTQALGPRILHGMDDRGRGTALQNKLIGFRAPKSTRTSFPAAVHAREALPMQRTRAPRRRRRARDELRAVEPARFFGSSPTRRR